MTNVVNFRGAMHPRNALRIVVRRPLTESDLDAQIAENRELYDAHCEAAAMGLGIASPRPSLIALDSSLRARFIRWLRWTFQLKGLT